MASHNVLFLLLTLLCPLFSNAEEAKICNDQNRLYKICTDQTEIYNQAITKAVSDNKLVLITFGADWCPWCKSMHKILSDKVNWSRLEKDLIAIDIGLYWYDSGDTVASGLSIAQSLMTIDGNQDSFKNFDGSVPALVVVDPKTSKAIFIFTGVLEDNSHGKGHDTEKVIAAIKDAVSKIKQ